MCWSEEESWEEGTAAASSMNPSSKGPLPSPCSSPSGSFLFGLAGLGFRRKGGMKERQPGASALSPLSSGCLPLSQAALTGKPKLQQETEYLFGLDGVGLAVNQKFSLTSSRKRQEIPALFAEACSKSSVQSAPPPALGGWGPGLALGRLLAARSRDT